MNGNGGLNCTYAWSEDGITALDHWARLEDPSLSGAVFHWIHLARDNTGTEAWLSESSGLDRIVQDALLADETRPRCTPHGAGFIINLRGVNLNPGAEPEDMISLRMWLDNTRLVSLSRRPLLAIQDIRQAIADDRGPSSLGGLFVMIAERLTERMGPVIGALEIQLDAFEETERSPALGDRRAELSDLRRQAAILRRFISPQRDALAHLAAAEAEWLALRHRQRVREAGDDITRYVENLNVVWERAAILQDELSNRLAEQTNNRLYLLSVVAGLFLPLTFVAGLLGINVGGIPLAESPWGFAWICGLLLVAGLGELWLFRRLHWL